MNDISSQCEIYTTLPYIAITLPWATNTGTGFFCSHRMWGPEEREPLLHMSRLHHRQRRQPQGY
jgi:hypothetical protein